MTAIHDLALPSSFGLTCLLLVGLFFFIRASTKDRTETALYQSDLEDVALLTRLQSYFDNRAYRVTQIDATTERITVEGTVSASVFLATFLGILAAIGLLCVALVWSIAFPQLGASPYLLVLAATVAPWFYWQGANRSESVTFQLNPAMHSEPTANIPETAQLRVTAHRDELLALESQNKLKRMSTD